MSAPGDGWFRLCSCGQPLPAPTEQPAQDDERTMTTDHTPERLSEEESETLAVAIRYGMGTMPGSYLNALQESVIPAVEAILAAHLADVKARLAAVEALAEEWAGSTSPDWGGQVQRAMAHALLAALHPDPSETP